MDPSVAHLSVLVLPPALEGTIVEDGARVAPPCGHCDGRSIGSDIGHHRRVLRLFEWTIAQLSEVIKSPARQGAVVEDGARVFVTRRDRDGRSTLTEVYESRRILIGVTSTIAQITVPVIPPAHQGAVVEDGAHGLSLGRQFIVRVSEREGLRRGHRVGGVGELPLDGPRDLPRGRVHREPGR